MTVSVARARVLCRAVVHVVVAALRGVHLVEVLLRPAGEAAKRGHERLREWRVSPRRLKTGCLALRGART
jgi:hypothetical protein